jgi:hypothetical protein
MSDELSFRFNEGWSIGATIWLLGGVDIGYYVGFLMSGVSYWAAIKYMPNLTRVSSFSEGD